jgi:outer membrane usher protein FimD/PapC
MAIILFPAPVIAEQLISSVILNQENKGDFFVNRSENGDFLMKIEDLKTIGFRTLNGKTSVIEGETYLSLRSMAGVAYTFNEGNLSLAITADPSLLTKKIVDFLPKDTQKVYYPSDTSVFLNYGADYLAGDGFSFTSFNLTNELGARKGNILFLTDSVYSNDLNQDRFVRLQSSFTYDDRQSLHRFIAGDFYASSGSLGSNLNLGGISLAKVFSIDPYFIYYPTLGLTSQVALPSEAKIYLNGMLIRTEKLSPGEFQLQNITPYGAAGTINVVLKDSFGREQSLSSPFYFGGMSLLKKGLQDYNYSLGLTRDQFGTDSNRYSKPVFTAFHQYGVSDSLTLGLRGEAGNGLYNFGPQATLLIGHAGLVGLSLAGSAGESANTGGAGIFTYVYQGLHIGANLSLEGFTRDYANIATNQMSNRLKSQANAGVSYSDSVLGALSVGYTTARMYVGQDADVANAAYTRNLTRQTTITATYRRVREEGYDNQFFISLNYTPKPDLFVSSGYQATKGSENALLEVQKNPPVGEGFSYQAILQKTDTAGQTTYTVDPTLQYNGRYGIYLGEVTGTSTAGKLTEQYHLSTSGALVFIGNVFGATRPVYDSFGLVKVGDLEGVKVLLNSQEIGETDSSGKLFIPNLGSFYKNQVSISDKEIPIDYYLSNVVKQVSPPLRSGSCIPFVAKKLQMISGVLMIRISKELKPVEFQEITLIVNGKEFTFPTGTGGAFDIDLSQSKEVNKLTEAEETGCNSIAAGATPFLKPGSYRGVLDYQGRPYAFSLTIPTSTESFIDLGQILVDVQVSRYRGSKPTRI